MTFDSAELFRSAPVEEQDAIYWLTVRGNMLPALIEPQSAPTHEQDLYAKRCEILKRHGYVTTDGRTFVRNDRLSRLARWINARWPLS